MARDLKILKGSPNLCCILRFLLTACLIVFFPLSSLAEKKNKEETMIRPPMPESLSVMAYIGTKTEIDLRVVGRIQEPLKILIRKKPRNGTLSEPVRINRDTFRVVYSTPADGFEGADFFTYAAQSVDSPVSYSAQVQISIRQKPAQLEFPSLLDFGTVPVGDTREMQVVLRNSGGKTVHLKPTLNSPWGLVDPLPISISGGETKKIRIAFSAVSSGVFAAKFSIDGDSKGAISLRGASENPLQWPSEAILFTSKKRDNPEASVLFTNPTDTPRHLVFQWPDFLKAPSHITIDPKSSMEIPIRLQAIPSFSWDGSVPFSSGNFERSLAVLVEAAPPRIEMEPSTPQNLGEFPIGSSAKGVLRLTNSGGRSARLTIAVPNWIKLNPSPAAFLVKPGEFADFEATVTPQKVGAFDFSLPVNSDSETIGTFRLKATARAAQPIEKLLAVPVSTPTFPVPPPSVAAIPPVQEFFLLDSTPHSITVSWKVPHGADGFVLEFRRIVPNDSGPISEEWIEWKRNISLSVKDDLATANLKKLPSDTFWMIRVTGIDTKGVKGPPSRIHRIETTQETFYKIPFFIWAPVSVILVLGVGRFACMKLWSRVGVSP
jgi:hypothetical protein